MYSFRLKKGDTIENIYPDYEDFNLTYEVDLGMGKRKKLSGKLYLKSEDAQKVYQAPFETKFELIIRKGVIDYWQGFFYIEECNIDYDNEIVTIESFYTDDKYREVEEIMEKTVNLSKINCKKSTTTNILPQCVQVYVLGDNKVLNFSDDVWCEKSVNIIDFDTTYFKLESMLYNSENPAKPLYNGYKEIAKINGNFEISQIWENVERDFSTSTTFTYTRNTKSLTTGYYMSTDSKFLGVRENDAQYLWINIYQKNTSTGSYDILVWESNKLDYIANSNYIQARFSEFIFYNVFYPYSASVEQSQVIITRILVPRSYGGTAFIRELESDDWLGGHHLYNYMLYRKNGEDVEGGLKYTGIDYVQDSETEYGINEDGKYFVEYELAGYNPIPLGRRVWGNFSLWAYDGYAITNADTEVKVQIFKIKDVFDAIFNYFGINLTFSSYILSNQDPLTLRTKRDYCLSHVSNMIQKFDNYTSATNNETSLNELLSFFSNRYNFSWHIKNNEFILEHKYFFLNNLSYATNDNFIDLTDREVVRMSKSWASNLNVGKYEFDRFSKLKFTSKRTADTFNVSEVKLNFDTPDIEEIESSEYFTDIYYLVLFDAQTDGLFFFAKSPTTNKIERWSFNYKKQGYNILNAEASLPYCSQYFRTNQFCDTVLINDKSFNVLGEFYCLEQEVELPNSNEITDFNPNVLYKTHLGIAYCNEIVVNLINGTSKLILKHKPAYATD